MTEKRFDIQFDSTKYFCVVDVANESVVGRFETISDAEGYLELYEFFIELQEENEQLKERNEHLEKQLKCITQSLQSELNYHGFMSSLR